MKLPLSFTLPESGSGTIFLDLSGTSELAEDSYQIKTELSDMSGTVEAEKPHNFILG